MSTTKSSRPALLPGSSAATHYAAPRYRDHRHTPVVQLSATAVLLMAVVLAVMAVGFALASASAQRAAADMERAAAERDALIRMLPRMQRERGMSPEQIERLAAEIVERGQQ